MSMLSGVIDVPQDPSSELPLIQKTGQVGTINCEIPPSTLTRNTTTTDEDGYSDTPETDEEDLDNHEIDVYEDFENLKGDMLQVAMEASLHDTSMIGSSGSKPIEEVVPRLSRVIVEIGIDTQVEATPVFGSGKGT
ncbi:hypothetical protein KY289_020438 [Solanum tuberosum]|nr:hypothetical protein KY289_020438 [Solanum tuberosum]